jgi:hypothetical protein
MVPLWFQTFVKRLASGGEGERAGRDGGRFGAAKMAPAASEGASENSPNWEKADEALVDRMRR